MATLCPKISALCLLSHIIFGIMTDQVFFRRCAVASTKLHVRHRCARYSSPGGGSAGRQGGGLGFALQGGG